MQVENIPTWLSDAWDISEDSAKVVLSIIVLLFVMLPTLYLARGKRGVLVEVVLLFFTMSFLVGIGWLPFWLLIAAVALMAAAIAMFGSELVTGD